MAVAAQDVAALHHLAAELEGSDLPQAVALHAMTSGHAEIFSGSYHEALHQLELARLAFAAQGDTNNQALCLSSIGMAHAILGAYPDALVNYDAVIDLSAKDDLHTIATHETKKGAVYTAVGMWEDALSCLNRALEAYQSLGSLDHVARVYGLIGETYVDMDLVDEALRYYGLALDRYQELGLDASAQYNHIRYAGLLVKLGRLAEAEDCLQQYPIELIASQVARSTHQGITAELMMARGDLEGATSLLSHLIEEVAASGRKREVARLHVLLRDIAQRQGNFEAYILHNDAATQIRSEISGRQSAQQIVIQKKEREMAVERQEREKERALLYGALPEHIATRMLAGETIEDHFEHAAVLFTDITGFTTHTSSMHPSETIKLLEDLYKTFDAICAEHGVIKVKTIGDSYLCFAHERREGLSAEERETAQRIAQVALAMQNAEFYWPSSTANNRIQLRIGIHSGPVSAGVIGTQRLQYDIWGDTVNVASRMESTGEAGRIQVSEAFAELLRLPLAVAEEDGTANSNSQQHVRERGAIEIKGKGSMTTYWLEGA